MVGIYVGRANVGKSSLLNALVNQKSLLSTSKKAVSNHLFESSSENNVIEI